MAVNKYSGNCVSCGGHVPAGGGTITRTRYGRGGWKVQHVGDCSEGVVSIELNSGAVLFVNRRGRCEDAPCCGCCS